MLFSFESEVFIVPYVVITSTAIAAENNMSSEHRAKVDEVVVAGV